MPWRVSRVGSRRIVAPALLDSRAGDGVVRERRGRPCGGRTALRGVPVICAQGTHAMLQVGTDSASATSAWHGASRGARVYSVDLAVVDGPSQPGPQQPQAVLLDQVVPRAGAENGGAVGEGEAPGGAAGAGARGAPVAPPPGSPPRRRAPPHGG